MADRLEAQVRAAQQATLLARLFGSDAEAMTLDDVLADFNDALESEPTEIDDADRELREALGLRSGRG